MELEMAELKKTMSSMEMELKANRGTIARLAAECEQHHKSSSDYLFQIQAFVKEKEEQELIKRDLSNKVEDLRRENNSKDDDLKKLTQQLNSLTNNINDMKNGVSEENSSLKDLRREILKHLFGKVKEQTPDQDILKKISELKEAESECEELKKEIRKLSERLREMPDEYEMKRVRAKLKTLEAEFSEMSAPLEGLKKKEGTMTKFIGNLTKILGIDEKELGRDPPLDALMDAISLRADQLANTEVHLALEQKSQIYSLQRKVKSLNETLASRNFHLDLLKKKLASLEEQKSNKSDFEKEKDEACVKAKKLMKLVENYKKDLVEAKRESRDFKDRLASALKAASENHSRDGHMEELMVHSSDLETLCRELNARIETLKRDLNEEKKAKERMKEELLRELEQKSALVYSLQDGKKRSETFKQKLSELLTEASTAPSMEPQAGLGMAFPPPAIGHGNLAEEEIVERTRALIDANRQNAAAAYVLDSALSDMAEGLKVGYRKAAMKLPGDVFRKPATIDSFERSLKNLSANPS